MSFSLCSTVFDYNSNQIEAHFTKMALSSLKFVVALLAILSGVRMSEQSQSCITNLLPQLRSNSEKYTVYFTIPKNTTILTDSICPTLLGKILIIHCDTTQLLKRLLYKHSNTYNIIISHLSNEDPAQSASDTVVAFINTVTPTNTLFLFTTKIKVNIYTLLKTAQTIPVYPTLKAVIYTNHRNSYQMSNVIMLNCLRNNYCPKWAIKTQNLFETNSKFTFIHRSLHQNAYGSILHGLPENTAPVRFFGKNIGMCQIFIKFLDPLCHHDIMAYLILAEVTNSTLVLHQKSRATMKLLELTRFFSAVENVVYAMYITPSLTVPIGYLNHLHFDKYDSTSLLYCEKGGSGILWYHKFSFWYDPFTTGVWLGFKLVLVFTLICFCIDAKDENVMVAFVNLISVVFGHGDWKRRRYYFVAYAIAFLFLVYGNSLLSIITSIPTLKGYDTFKQLMEVGKYKIAWLPRVYLTPPENHFGFDFKLIGWDLQRLTESFHFMPNALGKLQVIPEIAKQLGKLKLAVSFPSSKSDFMLKDYTYSFRKLVPSSNCFKVKQTLNPKLYSWNINMENQYWILRTLEQIVESGLLTQWRMRSLWGRLLRTRYLQGSKMSSLEPNYLDLEEFVPIFVAWFGLIVTSSVIFFIEMSGKIMRRRRVENFKCHRPNTRIM
ncbi:unnamed protein product [Orchesella dallaii]|uniref:Ionotropic receptor n=1 Tax=Orchesella dallaii TaxID=48710 RepID=A0ABP1QBN3_9HEXA